jgi:hypothetical protein
MIWWWLIGSRLIGEYSTSHRRVGIGGRKSAEIEPLAAHGGNRRVGDQACNTRFKYGDAEYTKRRLKRDNPELLERVLTGV